MKLIRKGKLNAKNSFNAMMPNLEKLPEYESGRRDEEAWRKYVGALECELKLFSLRTDAFQLGIDQLNQSMRGNENPRKVKEKPQELQEMDDEEGGESQLKFKGGKEWLFEDDSYTDFNIEQEEIKDNPAFIYLGSLFDKEGGRGLRLNELDVSNEISFVRSVRKPCKSLTSSSSIELSILNPIGSKIKEILSFLMMGMSSETS